MVSQQQQKRAVFAAAGVSEPDYHRALELEKQSWVDVALQAGGEVLKEILGINDMAKCFGQGDVGACAMMVLGVIPWGKILKAGKIVKALDNAVSAVKSFLKQQEWAKGLLAKTRGLFSKGDCNSFTPETQVLMADGSRKPIGKVRLRDRVLATDPKTGRTEAKTVARLIIGYGRKSLVDITVDTDGVAGSATGVVTATDGHPFWLPGEQRWVTAEQLQTGSMLQTSTGDSVQVTAVRKSMAVQLVYNLTVEGIRTYYVQAGETPVLVHNSNCSSNTKILGENLEASGVVRPADTAAHHIVASTSGKAAPAASNSTTLVLILTILAMAYSFRVGRHRRIRQAHQFTREFTRTTTMPT